MGSYIAVDLGAESGRAVLGTLDGGRLALNEISRFPNGMESAGGALRWNADRLFGEIVSGLRAAADACERPDSIGIDTWGVDFALLARNGALLEQPVAYRDPRTDGMMEKMFRRVPRETIYEKTGIQFMKINTLYQLFALSEREPSLIEAADKLLLIPDYFNYLLTGKAATEFTNATTTQIFNVREKRWDADLIDAAGAPRRIFQEIVQPGTALGALKAGLQSETGLGGVVVIAPATHDTGAAVAAAPADGNDWAYISSGTWSLMGVEIDEPVTTRAALDFNFTNEGGVGGAFRFLKNIMGLWLVQRCRSEFGAEYDYAQLARLAAEAPAFDCIIDVDDPRFLNPPVMIEEIASYCRDTGQAAPRTPGGFVRCALEGLALKYRAVLGELRETLGKRINRIHVIGGGSRNELLCGMAADATGLPVFAGPAEATAIGNMIVQALALGHVGSIAEARSLIRNTFEPTAYEPRDTAAWDSAWQRYMELKEKS